jgi:hypothetical protein
MTALARPFSIVTPALMLALGLTACDRPAPDATPAASDAGAAAPEAPATQAPQPDASQPEPSPAPAATAPTQPAAAPAAATPPPAPALPLRAPAPPPAAAAARWDVSRTRGGATATLADAHGPLLRIICSAGPARLRVDVPTFRPAARQSRLNLALGNNQLALAASRGAGGVTAVGALPANIAERILRARTIEARYGRQVAGPFTPPRGGDAMTLANACEEAVSPAPPRPASPLPGRAEQIPADFRGEWNARLQDCGSGRGDSRLIIDARTVRFYESRGEVTGVSRDGPRAITVEARYTGEGRTRTRSSHMSLSRGGEDLTIDGAVRHRCPTGAESGRPGRRSNR